METLPTIGPQAIPDQRQELRSIEVPTISCEIIGYPGTFTLVEIGFGGFSVSGPRTVPTGMRQVFRFTFPDTTSALVSAEARHTTQVLPVGSDELLYLTGFAFRDQGDDDNIAAVDALVDRMMGARVQA